MLAMLALAPGLVAGQAVDPAASHAGFELRTRWGVRVQGQFPTMQGEVRQLPDGRHRVHLRLSTKDMVVEGSPRHTAMARGPRMFDAAHHPWVEFVSEPYAPGLVRDGGTLAGRLDMRGTSHDERFVIEPSACDRPGHDCPVLAHGRVSRDDYGLDGWRWALADRVRIRLHVRLVDD